MEEEINLESKLLRLIASDRIEIPISSMSGKLKRRKEKIAKGVELSKNKYEGERVYARIEEDEKLKSRTLKEGIAAFKEKYPNYGEKLQELIDEERKKKETHLYFNMYEGKRIPQKDYMWVLEDLGFTPAECKKIYPGIMELSRKLEESRGYEERSILIG